GRFSYEDTGLLDRTHLHLFNYHSLRELFVRSGFRVDELSYTFHDMADTEIVRRLENLGLSASDKALGMFHTPEAAAFQFIVTAHPDESVSIEDFPALTDKPMESSIEVYRKLYDQLHQTGETAATRLEMVNERDQLLQQQRDEMHGLIEVRDQLVNQQQELNRVLHETQAKLADQQAKNDELSHQYKMSERAVRSMGHEKDAVEHRLNSAKQHLHDVTNSTGWRVYTKLMLPLSLFRRFKPAIGGLIKNPKMLATWVKEAKRLYKAGGLTAIRHRLTDHASPTYTYSLWIKDVEPVGLPKLESIEALNEWQGRPLISIVMPVYNVEEAWLREAIDSVLAQTYDDWELCIADDASTKTHIKRVLKEYETRFKRIKVVYREENGHISAATNSALELATGQFVGLMDHDDVLAPHALFFVAQEIILHPDASVFYSDEDKLNSEDVRYDHYFKPDFNPDLMRSHNMICHFGVYRRSLLEKVGGIREGYEGAQDYDLALRCLRGLDTRKE
ncbi:MAG: glycosyltransferase, partial [Candidatus Thiodiazotropha taylori]|nr:glycosyltransferase [Candidatus Thiodiazotropha taylori]MCW4251634.1 glycosyltransferase [Candidatus Thiodiazotropha taylori]